MGWRDKEWVGKGQDPKGASGERGGGGLCGTCGGHRGKTVSKTAVNAKGKTVVEKVWEDCPKCNGTGAA